MKNFGCNCGHNLKIHKSFNGSEEIIHPRGSELVFAGECLQYDCICPQFDPVPLNEDDYVHRDDDYVCGYTVVAYRAMDELARKCWECRRTIPAQNPRYIVRCDSFTDTDDLDFYSTFTEMDEPPTFTDMVMCVDCLHLDAVEESLLTGEV